MEKNKRKSRALIITFFIMIILLFIFYILFIKNNPLENTKGTANENRNFFSLFSKSKDKELDTLEENNENQNPTQNNTENSDQGEEIVTGINIGNNSDGDNTNIVPVENNKLKPIPVPDNDLNRDRDPDTDRDPDINKFPKTEVEDVKQCNLDDYKLKFTDAERAELEKLLREFYKFASSVKTEEDIDIEHGAKESYVDLVSEAKELTKQCYLETSSPTYFANFDFNNSLNDQDNTPNGTWLSKNYSRFSEARIERKVNPWYIFSNNKDAYSYNGQAISRSERFSSYGKDYRVTGENYNPIVFSNTAMAKQYCLTQSISAKTNIQNKLGANYKVSAKCFILDGLLSNTVGKIINNYRSDAWYPDQNWDNTQNSNIDPREYYMTEGECKLIAPSCTQIYKNDIPSQTVRLAPIEWAYSVDVVSPNFNSLEECQKTMSLNGHKGTCAGSSSTNAYIQKIWNQELLNDGSNTETNGYVPPIDYYLFEQMFNIW